MGLGKCGNFVTEWKKIFDLPLREFKFGMFIDVNEMTCRTPSLAKKQMRKSRRGVPPRGECRVFGVVCVVCCLCGVLFGVLLSLSLVLFTFFLTLAETAHSNQGSPLRYEIFDRG